MEMVLDPHNIERDDLFTFDAFLRNLSLRDLLVFQRVIEKETARRIAGMDGR